MTKHRTRTTHKDSGTANPATQADAVAAGAEAGRADIYQRVTDRIAAIEAGAGAWRMPWSGTGGTAHALLPANAATRKPYRGINTLVLWAAAQAEGYPSAVWATYRQWRELGAQVRKGERSSPVVFWRVSDTAQEEPDDAGEGAEDSPRVRVFARGYAVFNAAQVEGYEPPALPVLPEAGRIAHAEAFFAALGADIRHGGSRACYVPSVDQIRMPPFAAFPDPIAHYATLAHEATHWTGRPGRSAPATSPGGSARRRIRWRRSSRSSGRRSSAPAWRWRPSRARTTPPTSRAGSRCCGATSGRSSRRPPRLRRRRTGRTRGSARRLSQSSPRRLKSPSGTGGGACRPCTTGYGSSTAGDY